VTDAVLASDAARLDEVVRARAHAVTSDPSVVCGSELFGTAVEATGHVGYGAAVAEAIIGAGKHLVLMNAELDATVGPLLRRRAVAAGVVLTGCDGDQPGVQLNLIRFVEQLGLVPRVAGNIKGLQDRYRNPTTRAGFAKAWGQTPSTVTSFADGTKISFEQALVANATGLTVARRGMIGIEYEVHVDDVATTWTTWWTTRTGAAR